MMSLSAKSWLIVVPLVVAGGWNVTAYRLRGNRAVDVPPGYQSTTPARQSSSTAATAAQLETEPSISAVRSLIDQYCAGCHNTRLKMGETVLAGVNVAEDVVARPEVWERVVRRLRSGTMPPADRPRPDPATYGATASALEAALDAVAAAHPNPGRTTAHRLNRTEYANAIRDLFALDVDASSLLPADDADLGFDNMADILSFSPVLMERSMSAARKISRMVVGDPAPAPVAETFSLSRLLYQDDRMDEELPFGSRGGLAVRHNFPADGDYRLKVDLRRNLYDYIRGLQRPQQLRVLIDGALVHEFAVGGSAPGRPPAKSFSGDQIADPGWEEYTQHADDNLVMTFPVTSGPHVLGVTFVQARSERDGELRPRATSKHLALNETWSSPSEAPEAAVDRIVISGPFNSAGRSETASRKKVFVCQPSNSSEDEVCATTILTTVARRAFRAPLTNGQVAGILAFYRKGATAGGFDEGIRAGLERILVDPRFLFRTEREPSVAATTAPSYRISDVELASRLSFFLWSSIPDDELLDVAIAGKLKEPAVLEAQVRRMLADGRSRALVTNFAIQWLHLRKLQGFLPDQGLYGDFDDNLRQAFLRETELFIDSQLREDRGLFELLTANYTYVNERLARHYGIPNVHGSRFRRVSVTGTQRGGLLAHGSILSATSYPNRTSPVLRGHWLLENVLGTPPPPPPPDVPALPDRGRNGQPASVRQRLEEHRRNPVCANCHAPMDPLGFALENYDAIGRWRTTDEAGVRIDASGVMPGGVSVDGLAGLRKVLEGRREQFVQNVTEKLLTYALGRGLEYYDMPQVRTILKEAAPDYRWSSVVLGIVRSLPFQMRRSQS